MAMPANAIFFMMGIFHSSYGIIGYEAIGRAV
jgi:hypothetical protein